MKRIALLTVAIASLASQAFIIQTYTLDESMPTVNGVARSEKAENVVVAREQDFNRSKNPSSVFPEWFRTVLDISSGYSQVKKAQRIIVCERSGVVRVTDRFEGLKPGDVVGVRFPFPVDSENGSYVISDTVDQSDSSKTVFSSGTIRRSATDAGMVECETVADVRGTAQMTIVVSPPRQLPPGMYEPPKGVKVKTVTVENPLGMDRGNETISIPLAKLGLDERHLRVYSRFERKYLPHQTWDDNGSPLLLFSAKVPASSKQEFLVFSDSAAPDADLSDVCVAEYAPHRLDDMLWENDMFALRTYGYAITLPPPKGQSLVSSGIDVFVKNVPFPCLHDWTMRNRTGYNYHLGEGEGHDNYLLGTARGLGGLAAFDGAKWSVSSNWVQNSHRIIAQGPVRCSFEIAYAPWCSANAERRRVTFDRGQPFCKMEAFIDDIPEGTKIGPGLDISAKRKHAGTITSSADGAWIANFEPKDGFMGSIETAVVIAPEHKAEFVDSPDGCRMLLSRTIDGKLTWYIGSGWDLAGHYRTSLDWGMAVKAFSAGLRTPLNVTISE